MIDPDFWTDEKLGECTRDERLLFMGLISNADDEGRGRANPKLVKSTVFPYDEDLSSELITSMLKNLDNKKIVQLYIVDKQEFYFIRNFKKHQVINKKQVSKLPPSPQDTVPQENYGSSTVAAQECSVPIEEKRKEEKRKEENTREEKGHTLYLCKHIESITSGKWYLAKDTDALNVLITMYPYDWIKDALNEAAKKGKYSINYVEGTLKNWTKEGNGEQHGSNKQRIESEDRAGIGLEL